AVDSDDEMSRRFVALLRGINVGTAKRVPMADLRAAVESLGLRDVKTLLNSGNVVFTGEDARPADLAAAIEHAVFETTGVTSKTIVLAEADVRRVVAENALADFPEHSRLLVMFFGDAGRRRDLAAVAKDDWSPERVAVGSIAAYFWCPNGVLESRALKAAGKILGADVTTRNWATGWTVQPLAAMGRLRFRRVGEKAQVARRRADR